MNRTDGPRKPRPLFPDWNEEDAADFKHVADNIFKPLYKWLIVDLEDALCRPIRGLRVLDIGGGPGNMAVEFLTAGASRVVEVDVSAAMIEMAVGNVSRLGTDVAARFTGLVGEAASLPVETGSVDLVFSRGSIQFWPNLAGAFDEMGRVLAPGGLVYVGGGYGLNLPEDEREVIVQRRAKRDAEIGGPVRIPPMDREGMEQLARARGGDAVFLGNPPGFWLHWRPKS